jgi:DNA-3-methyladenine glycosylase
MKPVLDDALTAARLLLGWKLISLSRDGLTAGYIVETEAYTMADAASHSFHGRTKRNWPMFEKAGTIYVYFSYGLHYCLNITTGPIGDGQAVLIRALQPVEGLDLMEQRRRPELSKLTNGPAKLTQALAVTTELNGQNLFDKGNLLSLKAGIKPNNIKQTNRIGITLASELNWRFFIQDNPYVSTPSI